MPDVSFSKNSLFQHNTYPENLQNLGVFSTDQENYKFPNLLQYWDKNTWFVTGVFDRDKEESRKQELLSYKPIF